MKEPAEMGQQSDFETLTTSIRAFATARDWERFHTPKNLAMALAGEAGELAAEFQWLTPDESQPESLSPQQLQSIALEMADVQIYLLRLADVLGIHLPAVIRDKMVINEERFPAGAPQQPGTLG